MTRSDSQFKLRLPVELKETLEAQAKANKRSINAEVLARLENSLINTNQTDLQNNIFLDSQNKKSDKVKLIKIGSDVRIIQGIALNYLDVDFSLPLDDLKAMLHYGMQALIESNHVFKKWRNRDWSIYRGGHHIRFIENGNLKDLDILFVGDSPIV